MDDRLAEMKDEIDRILSRGPVGRWSNPPPAFPFLSEIVVFNADGSGEMTSWSAMSGKTVQAFTWNMEGRARLVMRYGLTRYAARVRSDPRDAAARRTAMNAVNPQYVLRNWMAEGAIVKARQGDYSEIGRVLDCLRQPYTTREGFEDFAKLPPDWASGLEVSCSS